MSKPLYQCNVNMFTSTLECRVDKVHVNISIHDVNNINMEICTKEDSVTVVVSPRQKREASQEFYPLNAGYEIETDKAKNYGFDEVCVVFYSCKFFYLKLT